MARITFTEDVTLTSEPVGTGPHFRRGYSPDVSDHEARRWVGAGVAVHGVVDLDPHQKEEKEKPVEEAPIPTFRKKRFRQGE